MRSAGVSLLRCRSRIAVGGILDRAADDLPCRGSGHISWNDTIDLQEQRRLNRKRKRLRHMDDADKQQAADDMRNTYQDLIIKEIMK